MEKEMKLYVVPYWDGDKDTWECVVADSADSALDEALELLFELYDYDDDEAKKHHSFVFDEAYPITDYGDYKIEVVKK